MNTEIIDAEILQLSSCEDSGSISITTTSDEYHELPKMSDFEAYISICKGYCAINILILPKQFSNGGWLVSILSINLGCYFVLYCAQKLIDCSFKVKSFTY